MKTLLFTAFAVSMLMTGSAPAQETKKLDPAALKSLDSAPATEAPKVPPKFVAKGAPRETKREYLTKSVGGVSKAARVITMSTGDKIEAPVVDIPLLFNKNEATLKDAQSRDNLNILAAKIKQLEASGATFCIEGHASAEGDGAFNEKLSQARATAIAAQLRACGVSPSTITGATGFGSRHASQPASASESLLAQDRRVLIVREK
ncbi:MAG TPA: OmpA family protein [Verrucomicrobiales bacterium]|jgi:outer membrane protein OmpA-like peptidoglycan-associated protein|nr:OmpA family protein [Verrucomicrobiales bacterium]